jgi:hypothetical protein
MPNKIPLENLINRAKTAITQTVSGELKLGVEEQTLNEEITSLKEIIKYDKFFFVVDMLNQQILEKNGIAKWLEYNEDDFGILQYFQAIHSSCLEYLIHLATITAEFANKKDSNIGFNQQQYVIDVALKHANGHYVQCKRALSAWQWQSDENTKVVTQYLNVFTIINPHLDEVSPEMFPRMYDQDGNKLVDIQKKIQNNSIDFIENKSKIFTIQELRILRKIAYNPNITSKEIATAFKSKLSTIHTQNKKLVEKGRAKFHNDNISSAKELAILLKKNFMI